MGTREGWCIHVEREVDWKLTKCIHPQRNMLMINEQGEDHAVTPIMVNESFGNRKSVQIFCGLPKENSTDIHER